MATSIEKLDAPFIALMTQVSRRRSGLFTSEEDSRLPILTQIVQVPDGQEDEFVQHLGKAFSLPEWFFQHPLTEQEIGEFRECRDLARSIMEHLADKGGVLKTELFALSRLLRRYETATVLTGVEDEEGFVEEGTIMKVPEAYIGSREIFSLILKALESIVNQEGRVRRCDECLNAYQIQRDTGENRFCSNRCSSRRRKRQERMSKCPGYKLD